jgi:PmbA protein
MPNSPLLDRTEAALAAAKKAGAGAADAIAIRSTDISTGIRHGQPESIEQAESVGLGLRVFVGQSSATLSTSETSAESLTRLAQQAVAIARVAPPDAHARLADESLLAKHIAALDVDSHVPDMATLQRLARETEAAGRSHEGITNSEGADASASRSEVALATSHGFAGSYANSRYAISLSLIAGSGADMQRDYDYAYVTHFADLPAPETVGHEAAARTLARMNPRKVASQTAPVYFDPRAGRQLLSAFASAISGSSITRGTSFLKDCLGKPIFGKNIRITDDPARPRGLGSRAFDAEGVTVKPMDFVHTGELKSWLLDTRSANQLGLTTTGHASRGLASAPHPSTSNFYLHAGEKAPEALMREIGDGFYVTETIGHGTNLITGDFSVGASGFWIEAGGRAFPVSEVTIAGNLRDMFTTLIPADDLVFRYATNVPTLAIPQMTIAGN